MQVSSFNEIFLLFLRNVFLLEGLKAGTHELRAKLTDAKGSEKIESVQFEYPFTPVEPVTSPKEYIVGPLPQKVGPAVYKVEISPGGGLNVTINERTYPVESSYSYPHGGYNRFTAAKPDTKSDGVWKVNKVTVDDKTYQVSRRLAH